MPNDSLQQQLTATALLGTARAKIDAVWTEQLEAWGLQPGETAPARLLLQAAGLQQSLSEAGAAFATATPTASSLPEHDYPPISPSPSEQYLQRMLHEDHAPVLHEYLQLLADRKLALPPEHLPTLLDWAGQDITAWGKLFPILGRGGHFLLRHHPVISKWIYACTEEELSRLSGEKWLAGLRYWRFLAAAKTPPLIEARWENLTTNEQKKVLQVATIGRHTGDIPWLQKAQAASLKPLRQIATHHLLHLHDPDTLAPFQKWMRGRLHVEHRLIQLDNTPKSAPPMAAHWGILSASELKSKKVVPILLSRLPITTWEAALDGFLTHDIPDRIPANQGQYTYAICRAIETFGPDDWRLRLGRLGASEALTDTFAQELSTEHYQTLLQEHLEAGLDRWPRARQLLAVNRPWNTATTRFLLDSILKAMNQQQKNFATWLGEVGQYELLQKAAYQGAVLEAKVAGDFYYDLSGRNYQLGLLADDLVKAWKFRHGFLTLLS